MSIEEDDSGGLDDDEEDLKLKSGRSHNGQQWFYATPFAANYSKFISALFEGDANMEYIEFRAIDGRELQLIVTWFNAHGRNREIPTYNIENAKQLINDDTITVVTDKHLMSIFGNEWDVSFIRSLKLLEKDDARDRLYRLMTAVNYADVELLVTMCIIVHCLFYPLEAIRDPNAAIWYQWPLESQCRFYDQARKEQLVMHTLSQIIETDQDVVDENGAHCILFLIEQEEIYNYAIHRKLDLILSSADRNKVFDVDSLALIVTTKQYICLESIVKPHEKFITGFMREIGVDAPKEIKDMIQKWTP